MKQNLEMEEDMFSDLNFSNSDSKSELEAMGIKYLCSNINAKTAEELVLWILAHNVVEGKFKKESPQELTLIITSHGGSLDHCFAITDMMFGSNIPIRTIGTGVLASCGLMIFMAGKKGRRILTPQTSILSHQFSGPDMYEKEHELLASKKDLDITSQKVINHYKMCTGLTDKKIRSKLLPPSNVWLTAEEAKELHICDEIRLNNATRSSK